MCDSSSSSTNNLHYLTDPIDPNLSPMSTTNEEMRETTSPPGKSPGSDGTVVGAKQNQVGTVMLFGVPIVSLVMDGKERLCLAQISSTLLKDFSYNEIHNRRVALGINCVQCTPVQLEILRRAGAMPVTSRRCGMITRREAERLCKSFLGDHAPPQLPENFAFDVYHECGWGCRGSFVPSRYNSSRAKCIRCSFCQLFFSPNKFIFHSHRLPESRYVQPDAANFNSWRRHMKLCGDPPEEANSSNSVSDLATAQIVHAWEDVKAMFNGGTRKRLLAASTIPSSSTRHSNTSNHANSGNSSGNSGKGNSGTRGHSHGESQSSNLNASGNSGGGSSHSRGGNSHQSSKKEAASIPNPSSNAPAPSQPHNILNSGYTQDAPNTSSFPHQSPTSSLLHVSNPLLSPTSRLDSIWNPGLPGHMSAAAAAAVTGQGSRQCPLPGSPPFTALPFHPLSIPWLRRPIFPFSHPFGPTLLNEQGSTCPEKLVNLAVARQNQSAFKPVSRSVDPIFNWINGSSLGAAAAGALAMSHSTPATLPEDLSLNSSSGHTTPGATTNGSSSSLPSSQHFNNNGNNNFIVNGGSTPSSFNLSKQLENTMGHGGNNSGNEKQHNRGGSNNNNSKHHQIQILTTRHSESDDEENVDIESTGETEECSSTSSIWVSSTTAALGRSGRASTPNQFIGHNNNNTIFNNNNIGFSRRKRSAATPCYSSGEEDLDDRDSQSDNQDDSISACEHYEEIRSTNERGKTGKRKRLWVNEIISTTDEDDNSGGRQANISSGKGKGESKLQRSSSSVKVLLDSRE